MTTSTSYDTNNGVGLQGKPNPPTPTQSDAQLPFISNYMMALLNSLQTSTNNIYVQEAADANTLSMLQKYMQSIQKDWTNKINSEITRAEEANNFGPDEVAKINMMQAQMSTETDKANSAVGAMKSTLNNDVTNASQILNFFEALTTILSFLSGLLR